MHVNHNQSNQALTELHVQTHRLTLASWFSLTLPVPWECWRERPLPGRASLPRDTLWRQPQSPPEVTGQASHPGKWGQKLRWEQPGLEDLSGSRWRGAWPGGEAEGRDPVGPVGPVLPLAQGGGWWWLWLHSTSESPRLLTRSWALGGGWEGQREECSQQRPRAAAVCSRRVVGLAWHWVLTQ